ncbi:MAG: PD-(D/E)XK nuclease family protein [Filimonas sp.]|nr:PD-(D/E)XK nuclease family protein [Filimonas sp.]
MAQHISLDSMSHLSSFILELQENINSQYVSSFVAILNDATYAKLLSLQKELTDKKTEDSFNLFELISTQYRRENLHSDIIAFLLDPSANHNQGISFLDSFLNIPDLLKNSQEPFFNEGDKIEVKREWFRIDITILNHRSKQAILIENKINNAADMPKQLPRYHDILIGQGFSISSIVYIIAKTYKKPDTSEWTEEEKTVIQKLLHILPAYDLENPDLYNSWLHICNTRCKDTELSTLLNHYMRIIKKIGETTMNKEIMEQFLQKMREGDNYSNAYSFVDLLSDLLAYRRDKIVATFKQGSLPFERIGPWNNVAVIDRWYMNKNEFAIDIVIEKDGYSFQFFDRNYCDSTLAADADNPALSILIEIGVSNSFVENRGRYKKEFKFPCEENELYLFTQEFINKIQKQFGNANHKVDC